MPSASRPQWEGPNKKWILIYRWISSGEHYLLVVLGVFKLNEIHKTRTFRTPRAEAICFTAGHLNREVAADRKQKKKYTISKRAKHTPRI